ncbi:MAG: hypothetical protein HPY68_08740 [Candidatus Atribacteria bacterium]|nr:hypothetical protein [Candidatus Atribacteria bacterium]
MEKAKWMKLFLTIIGIASIVGMSSCAEASMRKLPPFTLYALQGEEERIPFSSWSLLYFFSPDCFACFNTVLQLQNEIKENEDLLFFPICSECDWRALQNLQESLPFDIKVYLLSSRDRAILGIWNTPTLFLLSPTGKVVQRWDKNVNYQEIARTISILTGKKVASRKNTKLSCTGSICE